MTVVPPLQTGDAALLFQTLLRASWYGIVSDADTPQGMSATLEAVSSDAVITTDVLVGPKGDPGEPAPIIDLQWPAVDQEADIATGGLGLGDKGKAWWVSNAALVYVWTGTDLQAVQPGPAGPTGLSPLITPTTSVIPLDDRVGPDSEGNDIDSNVDVSGTSLLPHYHFNLAAPQGPVGPSTNINGAPDFDDSTAPVDGQTMVWNESIQKWQPSDFTAKHPRLYSVPEAAFTSFTGLAQRQSILAYNVPAQAYDWTPYVSGHIKAVGIELDTTPLQIGIEVRLGDATTGQLIGRAFGNNSNWSTLAPHWSTSSDPTAAVSPDNGVAVVSAGDIGKIYVNLFNDGLLGAYIFNNTGAQLAILVVPVGGDDFELGS